MTIKLGFIGGSGIYNIEGIECIDEIKVDTPFGYPTDPVLHLKYDDCEFYFLSRHGEGHRISPSEINYRANIFALKSLGVRHLVSISAVGSLKEELPPRKVFLPTQYIDWTKGKRERTFFSEGMVGHVSTAYPIEKSLHTRLESACKELSIDFGSGGSHIVIEGPQFSSRAENEIYRNFGIDVIGMTNVPEAYLAKEAGMAYGSINLITDYDCWKEEHCTVEEIMKVMKDNYSTAQNLVKYLAKDLTKNEIEYAPENEFALVTKPEHLNGRHKEILEVILAK